MDLQISAILHAGDVHWIEGPSCNMTRRVFEDAALFVHRTSKANWRSHDQREETHDAVGTLVVAFQPFATFRLQFGVVLGCNFARNVEILRLNPEHLRFFHACKELGTLLRR